MRISLVVLVLAFAGLLAVDLAPSSTPRAAVVLPTRALAAAKPTPKTVEVAFVRNGWIVRVERLVPKRMSPAEAALRELTQGPTRAERRRGSAPGSRTCPTPLVAQPRRYVVRELLALDVRLGSAGDEAHAAMADRSDARVSGDQEFVRSPRRVAS